MKSGSIVQILFTGTVLLIFSACLPNSKPAGSGEYFQRYRGGGKYSKLKTPVYVRGERVFFEISIDDYLYPDDFGQVLFTYILEVRNNKNKKIFSLTNKKIFLTPDDQKKVNGKLKFFFDCDDKMKPGKYSFVLKLSDLNYNNYKEIEREFVLK